MGIKNKNKKHYFLKYTHSQNKRRESNILENIIKSNKNPNIPKRERERNPGVQVNWHTEKYQHTT